MKKALIITNSTDTLLDKTLFDVVKFNEEELVFVEPGDQVKVMVSRGNYEVIIPVGDDALALFGLSQIRRVSGKVIEQDGQKIVPCLSPGFIRHNSQMYQRFAEDLYNARNVLLGLGVVEVTNQVVRVTDFTQLLDLVEYIKTTGLVSFDFETTKLTNRGTFDPDFYTTTLSLSFQQGSSYVIPLYHYQSPNSDEFIKTCAEVLEKEVFNNPDITKIGHNIKFDLHCARTIGIRKIRGPLHDTMVMHHLIDETSPQSLKELVRRYYPRFANYENDLGSADWAEIQLETLVTYNALDSDLTLRLYWLFTSILLTDTALYTLFRNLSAPATKALFLMESRGMLINKQYITEAIEKAESMIQEQKGKLQDYPEVVAFTKAVRHQKALDRLAEIGDKITKEEERAQERKDKQLVQLRERHVKLSEKEFKTEKAERNALLRMQALEEEIKALEKETPTSDRIIMLLQEDTAIRNGEWPDHEVNFDSPAQMHDLIYGAHGFAFAYPKSQWGETLTGTGREVLELLKDRGKFIENLLIYRQMVKIYRTYLIAIRDLMDSKHRVHGTFKQHGTKTGRLSSANPNMQNIITRTRYKQVEEMVSFVKKSFGVPMHHEIMQADLSQAELRIIAHYANEPTMLKAYADGIDLHELTAANTRKMSVSDFRNVDPKEYKRYRYEAKSINFGMIYGISPEGYKDYARVNYGLNVSLRQAKKTREAFFETYPNLLEYHKIYKAKAYKYGYVRTFFGRKVHLPDIMSTNQTKQGHAERNAINSPIQGTAGEYTVFALVLISLRAPWLQLVNSVHDSILPYVHINEREEAIRIIKDTMENPPLELYFGKSIDSVGMKADFETSSSSWGELQEV